MPKRSRSPARKESSPLFAAAVPAGPAPAQDPAAPRGPLVPAQQRARFTSAVSQWAAAAVPPALRYDSTQQSFVPPVVHATPPSAASAATAPFDAAIAGLTARPVSATVQVPWAPSWGCLPAHSADAADYAPLDPHDEDDEADGRSDGPPFGVAMAPPVGRPATGFAYHPDMALHRADDEDEPERPERLTYTMRHLEHLGLPALCRAVPCCEAADEDLLRCHDQRQISKVDASAFYASTGAAIGESLYVSKGTSRSARLAAGGVVEAALRVARGDLANAFCLVRPPGHHSTEVRSGGFCFFNSVAVAARAAQAQVAGCRRVLVLDWDVHHCDGTESIFYDDPSVLVMSVHQHYWGRGHPIHGQRPATPPPAPTPAPEVSEEALLAALMGGDDSDGSQPNADGQVAVSAPIPEAPPAEEEAEDEEDVDDAAALAFFAGLGADVAGAVDSDSQSTGTTTDSSQRLGASDDGVAYHPAPADPVDVACPGRGDGGDIACDGDRPPFYPGTGYEDREGAGPGRGFNINVPWPCGGFGDAEYMQVLERLVVPVAREFAPDLVIVSSGFDCATGDTLGSMHVTPTGIYLMTQALLRHVTPKVVVALEGGYTLHNVARCSEAALRALLAETQGPAASGQGSEMLLHQCDAAIRKVAAQHAHRWQCLRNVAGPDASSRGTSSARTAE